MDDGREATRCGKFGYSTVYGQSIPYIFRNGEKYCADEMVWWHYKEQKVKNLGSNPKDFRYLDKYEMYDEEICLLNEINVFHNENQYALTFSRYDRLVKFDDVQAIFKHQEACRKKLKYGAKYKMSKGGIVRIRLDKSKPEIVLPFVHTDSNKRYVPVFVAFAEDTVPGSLTVTKITGIDVMYMRFLLHVLNIDLTNTSIKSKDSIQCVNLDRLVKHLKKFADCDDIDCDENYWPSKDNTENKVDPIVIQSLFASTCNNNKLNTTKAKDSVKPKSIRGTKDDVTSLKETAEPKTTSRKHKIEETEKPRKDNKEPRLTSKTPISNDDFYEVEEILDYTKQSNGIEKVLIRWKGYSADDDTWEPVSSLNNVLKKEVKEIWAKKAKASKK